MKTTLKSTILMMLGSFILSSCGIELPLGNLSLGTTPDIPTWTDEFLAVRTVNEAVVVFESNGWENIETYELEGYVAGIKDLETKPHMLVAYVAMDVAAVEAQFEQLAMAFTELQNLGETELQIILASLVEDGITDLNVSDTAVSYFENGYHCFIRMAGNTVLIQGPGDEDITQDDEILGEYNLPMTLKITHHRNGGNEATLIKVGQDYYATFIQSSVRQYRFLKYDPSSETWTAYEDTEFSSWAMRQTIRASELEDFLRNGAYFGFMLDFAGNYEVIGSDTYLDRSVTIFSDGTNMIDVDDEYGIVLRKAHQALTLDTYEVTSITTTASFAGLDLPAIINPSDDENEWLIDPPSTQFELKLLLESYGYTVAMLQGDGPLSSYADDFGINVRDFDAYLIAVKETSYYHIFYFASEAVALTALEAPYTVATEADGATVIQVGRVLIFDFS